MTNRGGDHGCKEEDRQEGVCEVREEAGQEGFGEEAGEEVVLPAASSGVDDSALRIVDAGQPILSVPVANGHFMVIPKNAKIGKMTLPPGLKPEEVTLSTSYSDEDENMRMVREVNEDPPDVLNLSVKKTIPAVLERIFINFKMESE